MTYQDFLTKYTGKGIDFDGAYGFQCMDLMHQYVAEVLGLTDRRILAAPEAKQVFTGYPNTFGSQYFDKINNTPTGVPQEGDIIFWKEPFGRYVDDNGVIKFAGHVAIFESGDINKFISFDQNFGYPYCVHINHPNYSGVLGWLRLKTVVPAPPPPVITQDPDRVKVFIGVNPKTSTDYGIQEVQAVRSTIFDVENKRDDLANQLTLCANNQPIPLTLANLSTSQLFSELTKRILGR